METLFLEKLQCQVSTLLKESPASGDFQFFRSLFSKSLLYDYFSSVTYWGIQQANKSSWTTKEIQRLFRSQVNIYDGAILRKQLRAFNRHLFLQKSSIADIRMGSKYASERQQKISITEASFGLCQTSSMAIPIFAMKLSILEV